LKPRQLIYYLFGKFQFTRLLTYYFIKKSQLPRALARGHVSRDEAALAKISTLIDNPFRSHYSKKSLLNLAKANTQPAFSRG
jgi:hypothetical protein